MQQAASGAERRVERILSRVRAEAGLRDLLIFGLGRIWLVLLELCALAYRALNRPVSGRSAVRRPGHRPLDRVTGSTNDRTAEEA